MSGYGDLGIVDAVRAIRNREVSSLELTEYSIARAERYQGVLNCFIAPDFDRARAAAKAADAALARGGADGLLHGLPLAHKDMFYRQGRVSTCGSRILADRPAPSTATALARLDAAGALDLGTLNMNEFAYGPSGHNYHYGHCRNAWDPDYITGGSSSGSGTSVAARIVWAALGSDTGGSIRGPSSFCGITGIKPTYGRVSRHGAMPLSFSLDHVGCLSRSAQDCARLLRVIAGPDAADPSTLPDPVPDYEATLADGWKGLRLGIPRSFFMDDLDPGIAALFEAAVAEFGRAGVSAESVDVPDIPRINAFAQVTLFSEAAAHHREFLRTRPDDYSDQVRTRLEIGLGITAVQYIDAVRARPGALAEFLATTLSRVDVLVTPILNQPIPTIEESDVGGGSAMAPVVSAITRNLRAFNYLGLPVLVVPIGFDRNGLPVGLQMIGRPLGEAPLLALGHRFQQVTDWHRRMPPEPRA